MANNNIPPTSSTLLPYFVPRIVMIATYTQSTQTLLTSTTNTLCRQTCQHSILLRLKQDLSKIIKQLTLFHNRILKQFKQTLDLMKILLLTLPIVLLLRAYVMKLSINNSNSNRKQKSHNSHLSNKHSHTKQRKQVTFVQDQQNSSELLDHSISMSEIRPILKTYEQQQLQTFQASQTFETLDTDCNQSLVQSASYYNEIQPMTTQAAMAQAALINFFGEPGTVTSIMNMVQPSHTQTLNELSDQTESNVSQQVCLYQFLHIRIQCHAYHIQHKQPLTLLHNKMTTDKVIVYHIIILVLILLLIQEE